MHPYHKHLAHVDTSIRQALELLDQLASDAIIFLVDDENKLLGSFESFGNTSSVSIPLTIASQLQNKLQGNKKLMLCGFGVGMSWATAQINVQDCFISNLVELE